MSSLASRMAARKLTLFSPGRLEGNVQANGPKELEAASLPAAMSPLKLPALDLRLPSFESLLAEEVPQNTSESILESKGPADELRTLASKSMAAPPKSDSTEPMDFLAPSPLSGRHNKVGLSQASTVLAPSPTCMRGEKSHKRPRSRSRSAPADRPRTRSAGVTYARTALFGSIQQANVPIGKLGKEPLPADQSGSSTQAPMGTADHDASSTRSASCTAETVAPAASNEALASAPSAASSRAPNPSRASVPAVGPDSAGASATSDALLDDEDPTVRDVSSWGPHKVQELTSKKQRVYQHPRRESPRAQAKISAEPVKNIGTKSKVSAESVTPNPSNSNLKPGSDVQFDCIIGEPREMKNGGQDPAPTPVLIPTQNHSLESATAPEALGSTARNQATVEAPQKVSKKPGQSKRTNAAIVKDKNEGKDAAGKKRQRQPANQTRDDASVDAAAKKRQKQPARPISGKSTEEHDDQYEPVKDSHPGGQPILSQDKGWSADPSFNGIMKTDVSKQKMLQDPSSEYCTGVRAAVLFQQHAFDAVFMHLDPGAILEDANADERGSWIYYVIESEDKKMVCSLWEEGEKEEVFHPAAGSEFIIPVGRKFKLHNMSKRQQVQLLVVVLRCQPKS